MTTLQTEVTTGDATEPGLPELTLVDARYALVSYVGHGGMGVVFRALDRLKGDIVALKRMTEPAAAQDLAQRGTPDQAIGTTTSKAENRQRLTLAREFRTLAALRHPNIISVLDYGFATNGEPFFTMELIERPRTVLEAAAGLPVLERIGLLVDMLRALSYLHRR